MKIKKWLKAHVFPRDEFDKDVRHTYFALRWGLALIAISLPIVLVGWGWKIDHIPRSEMGSLSAFYWLPMKVDPPLTDCPHPYTAPLRNWFVGSLTVLGACLIIYRGYRDKEDWLLNIAGGALIIVALSPMPWPPLYKPQFDYHYAAAFLFFGMIAATILLCADDTLNAIPKKTPSAQHTWIRRFWKDPTLWKWIYRSLAFLMFAAPFAVYLVAKEGWQIIGVEVAGAWVFAAYWIAKTIEVRYVSQVEPARGPAPDLKWDRGKLVRVEPTSHRHVST